MLQLSPDEKLAKNMAVNTEPVMALNHIDQFLGGMMTSEVEAVLRSEPLLGNPLSICDLIDA